MPGCWLPQCLRFCLPAGELSRLSGRSPRAPRAHCAPPLPLLPKSGLLSADGAGALFAIVFMVHSTPCVCTNAGAWGPGHEIPVDVVDRRASNWNSLNHSLTPLLPKGRRMYIRSTVINVVFMASVSATELEDGTSDLLASVAIWILPRAPCRARMGQLQTCTLTRFSLTEEFNLGNAAARAEAMPRYRREGRKRYDRVDDRSGRSTRISSRATRGGF